MRFALALCKDIAAGPDGLTYPFFCHLHPAVMENLLNFFNWVCTSEFFPDLWHQSVIPIPKPGKDHSLQAFGSLYTLNPSVLKIQRFHCDIYTCQKFLLLDLLTCKALRQRKGRYFGQNGPPRYPRPIIMLYPFRTTFPLFTVTSVPTDSPVGISVLWMALSWLT